MNEPQFHLSFKTPSTGVSSQSPQVLVSPEISTTLSCRSWEEREGINGHNTRSRITHTALNSAIICLTVVQKILNRNWFLYLTLYATLLRYSLFTNSSVFPSLITEFERGSRPNFSLLCSSLFRVHLNYTATNAFVTGL